MLKKFFILLLCFMISLFLVGCQSGLYDEGTVTTPNGDVFEVKSRSTTTGRVYSINDGDTLLLEVGDEEIRSSDFELIYDSDKVKAYLFYSRILVSIDNGSFRLVDNSFDFDETPEVDDIIAANLLRSRGTILGYYDIFKQRQPQKYTSMIEAYRNENYSQLSEFGLPTKPGPRETMMFTLDDYIQSDTESNSPQIER